MDIPVSSGGGITSPLIADLNFAEFKAVALVCDNGATVPASPTEGQWFLHTPTGRKVLLQYIGSAWVPIINYGTTTIYVDNTDGTDAVDNGGSVDAGAFKTIQYAINSIAAYYTGAVTININAETYSEGITISGKKFMGPSSASSTFTLQGTLSSHASAAQTASVQGTTSTFGSISDTTNDPFAGHAGDLLYSSNNAEYRCINSVTTEVATIVGYWTAAPSGTYTLYTRGTTISHSTSIGINTNTSIVINDINFVGTTAASVYISAGSDTTITRCKFSTTSAYNMIVCTLFGMVRMYDSYVDGTGSTNVFQINNNAGGVFYRNRFYKGTNQVYVMGNGLLTIAGACCFDGASVSTYGIFCEFNGLADCRSLYSQFLNTTAGLRSTTGSQIIGTTNNQLTSAPESETNTDGGYID